MDFPYNILIDLKAVFYRKLSEKFTNERQAWYIPDPKIYLKCTFLF